MSLQRAAIALERFWEARGCVVLPGPDEPAPEGLLAPEVFFRLFSPDPWRSVHRQAVRRWADARPELSMLRLGVSHQLVVLLKPPDAGIVDLCRSSLQELGFDLARHDLQLWERDREIDLTGLQSSGFGVRLDGLEVARIGYLACRHEGLAPGECVEISYALERMGALAEGRGERTAGVSSVAWGGGWSFERVRAGEEEELARYVSEELPLAPLLERFELLAKEADRCLDRGLPRLAYRCVLRAMDLLETVRSSTPPAEGDDELPARLSRLVRDCALAHRGRFTATR